MSESLTRSAVNRDCFNEDKLDLFWNFIHKRQKIWERRVIKGDEPPWTEDDILNEYRFTNIYRELDPGTQYAIQNILEADESKSDKIFNIMIYRLIGRSETHKELGFQFIQNFDPNQFERVLKRRRDEKNLPVFTGAYMVSGYNHMGSSDKVENVTALFENLSLNQEFFDQVISANSVESTYEAINSCQGFGNFLSYQVLVDLLYPVDYYNGDSVLPFSEDEWSSPGPGAKKGLSKLVDEFQGFTRLDAMQWLRQNQSEEFERLGIDFPFIRDRSGNRKEISLANIQNCLCEFYKYDKIRNKDGRARRKFRCSESRTPVQLREIYRSAPNTVLNT